MRRRVGTGLDETFRRASISRGDPILLIAERRPHGEELVSPRVIAPTLAAQRARETSARGPLPDRGAGGH
jgi:hypothetical protein